jgi:L-amino acid N-acyltransferase YncA
MTAMQMESAGLPEGLLLRDAAEPDAAGIAEIYNYWVRRRGSSFDLEEKSSDYFAQQIAGLGEKECFFVLEGSSAEGLLGFGRLERYSERLGYQRSGVTAVYLREGQQRRGLGSLIKRAVIERAKALGYHHLIARIVSDNTASIELNLRFGYTVVGTQKEVGYIDGQYRDVVLMQLILPE